MVSSFVSKLQRHVWMGLWKCIKKTAGKKEETEIGSKYGAKNNIFFTIFQMDDNEAL